MTRTMVTYVLLILLALLLLLAVGYVLYVLGQILIGILSESFRKKTPPRQFQHPDLGTFVLEDGLWSGLLRRDGRDIRFVVGGGDTAPDARLLDRAQSILSSFPKVEQQAVAFLRSRESEAGQMPLDFYMLDVTDGKRPDDFTLEFIGEDDGDRVWRVEFEAGQPKSTGFDD